MTKSAGNCWFDHIYWRILNGKLRFLCVDNKIKNIFKLGISWLYVIIVSSTSFRVNPHSIVCLNVTELLARSRCNIWSLSDSNETWTHNHLLHKKTLNHFTKLVKWLSYVVSTYLYQAIDCLLLSCHVWVSEWIHTL